MIPSALQAFASPPGILALSVALVSWAMMRAAIWPPFARLRSLAAGVSAVAIGTAVYAGAGVISQILNT
jgi:hypothetical protein